MNITIAENSENGTVLGTVTGVDLETNPVTAHDDSCVGYGSNILLDYITKLM